MPFSRSLLIIATTFYELGRFGKDRWALWNHNLAEIAADPKNVVGANNLYDAKYIEYFTGIHAQFLPSYCGYLKDCYAPTQWTFLLAPVRNSALQQDFLANFTKACHRIKCSTELVALRKRYSNYRYSDLAAHLGIVYVPYQVRMVSFRDFWRAPCFIIA